MKLLVVVDMQNDFVTGALGTPEAQAIVESVKAKIQEYRNAGDDIVFTKDTHYGNYLSTHEGKLLPVFHCLINTDGWDLVDGIYSEYKEYEVEKHTFGYLDWYYFLSEHYYGATSEIEIVGLCTDICVISNALILRATYPNIPIYVDAKCCAGTTPAKHEAALSVMESCQIIVER